jgi:hypothetical protein
LLQRPRIIATIVACIVEAMDEYKLHGKSKQSPGVKIWQAYSNMKAEWSRTEANDYNAPAADPASLPIVRFWGKYKRRKVGETTRFGGTVIPDTID